MRCEGTGKPQCWGECCFNDVALSPPRVFYWLVDNDRCSRGVSEARTAESCLSHMWSVFHIGFLHVSMTYLSIQDYFSKNFKSLMLSGIISIDSSA